MVESQVTPVVVIAAAYWTKRAAILYFDIFEIILLFKFRN